MLSKAVTAALKLIRKQVENYNFKIQYYSIVKTFWPVQSNRSIINKINKLNSRNKAISIFTFDIFTLYMNIPYHNLKSGMKELIISVLLAGIQTSLRLLNMVLYAQIIKRNIACLLIKHVQNQQSITYQRTLTLPWVVCVFVN